MLKFCSLCLQNIWSISCSQEWQIVMESDVCTWALAMQTLQKPARNFISKWEIECEFLRAELPEFDAKQATPREMLDKTIHLQNKFDLWRHFHCDRICSSYALSSWCCWRSCCCTSSNQRKCTRRGLSKRSITWPGKYGCRSSCCCGRCLLTPTTYIPWGKRGLCKIDLLGRNWSLTAQWKCRTIHSSCDAPCSPFWKQGKGKLCCTAAIIASIVVDPGRYNQSSVFWWASIHPPFKHE